MVAFAAIGILCALATLAPPMYKAVNELREQFMRGERDAVLCSFAILFFFLAGCAFFAWFTAIEEERKAKAASDKPEQMPYQKPECQGQCIEKRLVCHRCWHQDSDMGAYYRNDVIPEIRRS